MAMRAEVDRRHPAPGVHPPAGMKALVLYYSRSGTTRRAAEAIARDLGAELEEIQDPTDRQGARGYFRSFLDAILRRPAPIKPLRHDPKQYDLLLVGTPVWNASVSAPVRSLLAGPAHGVGKLAFFLTEGGRGERRVFRQMAEVAGREPLATLALVQRDVEEGRISAAIGPFMHEVRGSGPAPLAPSA